MKSDKDNNRPMSLAEFRKMRHTLLPENRKIKNARKVERDGIRFDSRLELFMYDLLKMAGIRFERQKRYTLQPGFQYNGAAIRPITYTVDFWLPDHNLIIDTKGYHTQQGDMRIKMLKWRFSTAGESPIIETPKNQTECRTLLEELKRS